METFEDFVAAQQETAEDIEVINRNFRKDPASRKDRGYYEERLRRLDEAWVQFEENDYRIRGLSNIPMTHSYFTDTYLRISNLNNKLRNIFEEEIGKIAAVSQPTPTAPPRNEQGVDKQGASSMQHSKSQPKGLDEATTKILHHQHALRRALRRNLDEIKSNVNQSHTEAYYISKAAIIDRYMNDFINNNNALWQSTTGDNIDGYSWDKFYEIEEEAHDVLSELQHHISKSGMPQNTSVNENIQHSHIQLPKVQIPKFNGNYLQWVAFKDLYEQLVHNTTLSEVQKMLYLSTHLGDEPKNLIKHLPISTTNYDIAWNILVNRYDNKRLIVTTLLNSLFSQQKMKNESAQALKNLHDLTIECVHGLKAQKIPVHHWDVIMVHMLLRKLDQVTLTTFEQSLDNNKRLINLNELLTFMQHRFQSLETHSKAFEAGGKEKAKATSTTASTSNTCKICGLAGHPIYFCQAFLKLSSSERLKWTQKNKLCVNCFKSDHVAKECKSRSCTKCKNKHNTLLHLEKSSESPKTGENQQQSQGTSSLTQPTTSSNAPVVATMNKQQNDNHYIFLATARVKIIGNYGRVGEFRALLDSGSQVNLVTERVINKLALNPSNSSLCIEGIGRKARSVTKRINFELRAHSGSYSTRMEAFVLSNIVSPQPTQSVDISEWSFPQNIKLADPKFNETEKIDILIGAEFYHLIMKPQQIKLNNELPILQNTTLGWIVTGKSQNISSKTATCAVFSPEDETTNHLIEKFWKLDDVNESERQMSAAESRCENHFAQNVRRDANGRFIVRLPFSENPIILGNSKVMAFNRFMSLERRLNCNPQLQADYIKFMQEYESLGHMEEIEEEDIPDTCYVMPHHCVLKPESTTTKLRVVFDASAKTNSGSSLNDILHTGPTVQSELFSILLRFRMHRFVFTADIEKMYRQISVNESDQMFQIIIWRYNKNQDIRYYRLKTVTYGTAAAPYLATKCLQQLAIQGLNKYPLGAIAVRDDFYVDDCLTGASTLNTALETQRQVKSLLQEAGFKLRKWCSNHPKLLSGIPPEDKEINLDLDDSSNCSTKTLGIIWIPKSDHICGRAKLSETTNLTKRIVSSELARIFDPLGIFGPVVVKAKIFLQQLWQLDISWDDELPIEHQKEWNYFRSQLSALNNIKVDRCLLKPQTPTSIQIHTFVDASERAYGAVVYLRSAYTDKTVSTRLICSKSRVAPIKTQTLPRLELCAAVLGAELTDRVKKDIRLTDVETFFWSDSQIVLSWINSTAASFYTFVANRIAKIQRLTEANQWRHVSSKKNPADAISRGLTPDRLKELTTWVYGPLFLSGQKSEWPESCSKTSFTHCELERKITKQVLVTSECESLNDTISRINHKNSFRVLQHIVGYILRFIKNSNSARNLRPSHQALNAHEMSMALHVIIKVIQQAEFNEELQHLRNQQPVKKSSSLASLNPFLDEHQIMRLGGRLEKSELPFEAKHPAILSHKHPFAKLLLQKLHEDNRHCGPQALLAASRSQFWITNGKSITRNIVHQCVRCTKAKPTLFKQLMGNLPAARVTPARPFITSGVDYFGPVWIHHKLRGKRPDKAYIAVFCCFATKAVHMEVVSNLSTEAFLGALRRFISRRGHCQSLYCDNATNFVGANNKLTELKESIYSTTAQEKIIKSCSDQSIDFKFIPPRAPHFGGLWEAAVKSAKHLLLRSVTAASLTYEELETVIVEIEAILNSRPLVPLSSNHDDLQALTPGHFLVGEALNTKVDANAKEIKTSLNTRWKIVSEIKHKFWKEWSQNYLHELQQRGKWKTSSPNLNEGMMVIIHEDNTPVLQWPIGRITRVYRGDDGFVRVIDVKTARGTIKRPIHRLAPLFSDLTSDESKKKTPQLSQKREHSADRSNTTNSPKRKLVSYSSQGIFSTILIALLLLPLALASRINVTEFSNNPGIYFEGIGSAKFITGSWRFIMYYDLTRLWERNKAVQEGVKTFAELCDQSGKDESCNLLTQFFHNKWDELIQEEDLIIPSRKRRAALNIIGNVANALFGMLDSEYAENMSQTIAKVKQNEDYLHNLIKNQTSVIDSTINILKDSENKTNTRFSQLKKLIYDDLNQLAAENSKTRRAQNIISLAVQLSMLITELQRIEEVLISALIHSNNGNISPLILTPHQLKADIMKIKAHLPLGSTLPVDDTNLLELYKIMKIKGAVTRTEIIFVAELPLVNQEGFDLYKLIPIPTFINNTMVAIKTDVEFLAVSKHRDKYLALNALQFNQCIIISDEIFLCRHIQIIFSRNSGSYTCEVSFFNDEISQNCNFDYYHNNTTFTAMYELNSWIYGTTKSTELTAVCSEEISSFIIKNSGILVIDPSCLIKSNLITIQGYETRSTTVHSSFAKFGEISAVGRPAEIKRIFEPVLEIETQLEQLTNLQAQLHTSNSLPATLPDAEFHIKYAGPLALLLFIISIIIFSVWRLKSKCQSSINLAQTPTQSSPRQQISTI